MGDPLNASTTQGPQADAIQHKTVLDYIEIGRVSWLRRRPQEPTLTGQRFIKQVHSGFGL